MLVVVLTLALCVSLFVPGMFGLLGASLDDSSQTTGAAAGTGTTVDFGDDRCASLPSPESRLCEFGDAFNAAGAAHGVDPRYLAAVAFVESSFDEDVIECRDPSDVGALGLMQFMPGTARERGVDPCDPADAIAGGAEYLRDLYDEFGTWDLAASAYNMGPQAVRDADGIAGNQGYVDDVNRKWREYRDLFPLVASGGGVAAGNGVPGGCPVEPRGSTEVPRDRTITGATAATQALAAAVIGCFGNRHGTTCRTPRDWGEHPRGRACDFMLTGGGLPDEAQRSHGRAMAEWVAQNATELNVIYVIWDDAIWNPSRDDRNIAGSWERWRDYSSDCDGRSGDPSGCHYNHVHVSVRLMPGDPPWAPCPPGIGCYDN